MIRHSKRENDDIGPSKGLMKWMNKLFRFVLYPFIHPMWFMSGVVILVIGFIAVPSYFGVEFKDISQWYKQKFAEQYQKAEMVVNKEVVEPLTDKVEGKIKKLAEQKFNEFTGQEIQGFTGQGINVKTTVKQPNKDQLVTYESPQVVNRKAFQRAQEIPVDVEKTLQHANKTSPDVFFKRNDSLGLTYLNVPKKVNGKIMVVNANEIKINGERVFLYGIYAAPSSENGEKALQYLMGTINNKNTDCYIGAYTKDGIGTAICLWQGININQQLVDLKYSKNVTLN